MLRKYLLDENGNPVPVGNTAEEFAAWSLWFDECWEDRVVESTPLPSGPLISTVFLSIDQQRDDGAEPVLWQTRVFGGPHNSKCLRYTSRAAALVGHRWFVSIVADAERFVPPVEPTLH